VRIHSIHLLLAASARRRVHRRCSARHQRALTSPSVSPIADVRALDCTYLRQPHRS
jgi:hypothetical protein